MGDADDSYDFSALDMFLERLRAGDELVMGNRFKGGVRPHAMPFLRRYLGNPVLSAIGRLMFKAPIGDFYCGLRGFRRDSIDRLHLHTPGMEFASEMVVWRGLRFLLMLSPRWLFLYPGCALMLLGVATMLWLLPGPRTVAGIGLDIHTLVFSGAAPFGPLDPTVSMRVVVPAATAMVVGLQLIFSGFFLVLLEHHQG